MNRKPPCYFRIEKGESSEEISRKLSQVPPGYALQKTKDFNLKDGTVTVLFFGEYPELTIEELLDGPLICYFGGEIK